jgi:hypothetical protein
MSVYTVIDCRLLYYISSKDRLAQCHLFRYPIIPFDQIQGYFILTIASTYVKRKQESITRAVDWSSPTRFEDLFCWCFWLRCHQIVTVIWGVIFREVLGFAIPEKWQSVQKKGRPKPALLQKGGIKKKPITKIAENSI